MILFVDDDITRHIEFARRYPGNFQTSSIVLAQAELNLAPSHISELWLDHDLGDGLVSGGYFDGVSGKPVGTVELTVRPLVKWLCESSAVPRSLAINIHSWNLPASASIAAQLREVGFLNVVRKPFSFGDEK